MQFLYIVLEFIWVFSPVSIVVNLSHSAFAWCLMKLIRIGILLEQAPLASVDMEDVMESEGGRLFVDALLARTSQFWTWLSWRRARVNFPDWLMLRSQEWEVQRGPQRFESFLTSRRRMMFGSMWTLIAELLLLNLVGVLISFLMGNMICLLTLFTKDVWLVLSVCLAGKKCSKAPKIQRLVTPLTLQRKRARIAEKKKRIAKAKSEAAEYQKLLATRLKEQRERRSESLAKKRSRLSAASKPSIVA